MSIMIDEMMEDWQTSPNNGWHSAQRLFEGISQIYPARNADGRLELFYTRSGNLYHRWQTSPNASGSWTGETLLPSDFVSNPGGFGSGEGDSQIAVGQNADGRLELFYVALDGIFYHNLQRFPSESESWTGQIVFSSDVPRKSFSQIAVGQNLDGRLELFYSRVRPMGMSALA